jgi:putative membrane protein
MSKSRGWSALLQLTMLFVGLAVLAALSWYTLRADGLRLLFESWAVPAVAALHLVAEAGCGYAWRNIVEPPRPSFWAFFRARWVRAAVASLTPVSGIGGAIAAIRLMGLAQLAVDVAVPSLVLDSTIEMVTQAVFTALGFGLLFTLLPEPSLVGWAVTTLSLAAASLVAFIVAQRLGALRLVDAGLRRLTAHWPRIFPLTETQLHDRLMSQYRRRSAILGSGCVHLGCWLLGGVEIWLTLFALGVPTTLTKCLIVESLGTAARSAGFFVPGALGIQEVALVLVGGLVGISPQSAMLLAIVKRLRDVVLGVPALLVWQWLEGRRLDRLLVAPKQG